MKVKELIEKLQKYDSEQMVVINGYEGGVNACSCCKEERIKLSVNSEWYYGNHEIVAPDKDFDCVAVYIG
jgi:hypothetical protein